MVLLGSFMTRETLESLWPWFFLSMSLNLIGSLDCPCMVSLMINSNIWSIIAPSRDMIRNICALEVGLPGSLKVKSNCAVSFPIYDFLLSTCEMACFWIQRTCQLSESIDALSAQPHATWHWQTTYGSAWCGLEIAEAWIGHLWGNGLTMVWGSFMTYHHGNG